MRNDLALLRRWLRRSRPPHGAWARAVLAGLIASLTNVALVVGAVGLLIESARRPGLPAVLGVLIVIELFAFLRSPLRFAERLSAHRLGFDAVTTWRRWLVETVCRLDFSRWRAYAAGDLLERSLRDTDELQDLWLRCVIPLVTTGAVMVFGDVVVGLLPPFGHWWPIAGSLLIVQGVAVALLVANFGPLLRRDSELRRARGTYRGVLVELSAVTPDLHLLGRASFAHQRSLIAVEGLQRAEECLRRRRRLSSAVAPIATALSLSAVAVRPVASPLWIAVASMIAFSSFESLSAVRSAVDTAVHVSAGATRLEELESERSSATRAWPRDTTIRLDDVTIIESGETLVSHASLVIAPGRRVALTGPSGTGKSTLLRALAALDAPSSGEISIGDVPVDQLNDEQLRRSLAYVPSEPGLTRGFALDVIALGRTSTRDALSDLASLGLDADRSTKWNGLSRGERERVALVRAFVTSPAIYLLDEPTGGLGADETASVLALLATTTSTIVIATHDADVIAWCDDVVSLRDASLSLNR